MKASEVHRVPWRDMYCVWVEGPIIGRIFKKRLYITSCCLSYRFPVKLKPDGEKCYCGKFIKVVRK